MASHPLNFLGFSFVLFIYCILASTEAFPSYYFFTDDEAASGSSKVDLEKTRDIEFPISLHGYGFSSEREAKASLANQIKEKLLLLTHPSPREPMKRNHAWASGFGKRHQDWFATYGKRRNDQSRIVRREVNTDQPRKRQGSWDIGYGK